MSPEISRIGSASDLGRTDEAIGLIDRLAGCFIDERDPKLIEHAVRTLIGQRVFGTVLGYEDLNDHESLRHDTVFGTLLGKLEPKRRADCAALAGKPRMIRCTGTRKAGSFTATTAQAAEDRRGRQGKRAGRRA